MTGKPTEEDLASLKSPYAQAMLEQLPTPKRVSLKEKYPKASPDALDLLQRLLAFNPEKRLTVDEAVEHKFFSAFRQPEVEIVADAPFKVPLDDNKRLSIQEYRDSLYGEISARKRQAKEGNVE